MIFDYFRHSKNQKLCASRPPRPHWLALTEGQRARNGTAASVLAVPPRCRHRKRQPTACDALGGRCPVPRPSNCAVWVRYVSVGLRGRASRGMEMVCRLPATRTTSRPTWCLLGQGHHSFSPSPLLPCPGDAYLVLPFPFPWSSARACPTPEFSSQPLNSVMCE